MLFKTTDEIKFHLGFISASYSFENLHTDLTHATAEFRRKIGPVYDLVQQYYDQNGGSYQPLPDDTDEWTRKMVSLLHKVQLPIILDAYLAYAPNSDLTHSEKGRQIFVGDNEKPAFEWQLERDENATRNRQQRAIEDLLRWLEENTQEGIPVDMPLDFAENTAESFSQVFQQGYLYISNGKGYLALQDFEVLDPTSIAQLLAGRKLALVYRGDTTEYNPEEEYPIGAVIDFEAGAYICLRDSIGQSPATHPERWGVAITKSGYIWEYKASQSWIQNNNLIVNRLEHFDGVFPLEGSYRLLHQIMPFLRKTEKRVIAPIVGPENLSALKERRRKNTLTEDDEDLIGFIIPATIIPALAMAVRSLSATLLPDGLLKQFSDTGTRSRISTATSARDQLAIVLDQEAQAEISALQLYLQRKASGSQNWEAPSVMPANSADNKFFRA